MMLYNNLILFLTVCLTQGLQLPRDHILWGPQGEPNTLVRRATATPTPVPAPTRRQADSTCQNGPLTRQCWDNGFSVSVDYDDKWPTTGVTRSYNFEITNSTCSADGITRQCLLVNGQYPGPTIYADWGDYISVTVKNSLQNNGTGIHYHGMRQLNTNSQDGANGLTECPLAPGDTKTYNFQATQYGSSWYHSHYTVQYEDGVVGPIVIQGPATANYDIDLGPYPITDWDHLSSYDYLANANATLQHGGPPPPIDTILINGTNQNAQGGGQYDVVTLTPGKTHLVRLMNTAGESQIRVTLDGHNMTIIAADFVPIQPFVTDQIMMGIGQRYDVLITADQSPGNYWFRANGASECLSRVANNGLAIFNYQGTALSNPTTSSVALDKTCTEPAPLVPWWTTTVPSDDFQQQVHSLPIDLAVPNVTTNGANVVAWTVDTESIHVDWEDPTLQYVIDGNTDYPKVANVIEIPNQGTWVYWILQEPPTTPIAMPHPMHLHGHDFWILGRGTGVFNASTDYSELNFSTATRRDTTMLPAAGWIVIAFETDNPGAWLMHCHIGTHISGGLGVQFLESKDKIVLPDQSWETTCQNWKNYYSGINPEFKQDDSGL